MDLSLILDVTLMLLLGVTIGYAVVLNRRLVRLRQGHGEMRQVVEEFNAATEEAQRNLSRIQTMAKEAARGPANPNWAEVQRRLNGDVERAQTLRDDLSFLVERGERLADGLEEPLRGMSGPAARGDGGTGQPRSEAEQRLMRAVQGRV